MKQTQNSKKLISLSWNARYQRAETVTFPSENSKTTYTTLHFQQNACALLYTVNKAHSHES